MNTPRTTLRYEADKYDQGAFSAYENMRDLAMELERELAEAIESRKFQLKLNVELNEREKQTHAELAAVTEERDELIQQVNIRRSNNLRLDRINREQQELIEHIKRLSGAKESDCVAMREMATKIFDLREQRDTLAEALNDLWHRHSLTEAAYELIEKSLATLQPQPLKTR